MIASEPIAQQTQVVTGICRWAYVNIWQQRTSDFGGKPKYSVVLMIPKRDTATLQKINAAIAHAYEIGKLQLKKGSMALPTLESISTPLHDGDMEHPSDRPRAHEPAATLSRTR